jgi:hypothetical protein
MQPARRESAGMTQDHSTEETRRRRIRRNTILLSLVAIGIYVAFVVSSMLHGQP